MKVTIEVDESKLRHYVELNDKRKELMNTTQERRLLYKNNMKKLEKDLIYKDASYEFVIAGIEQNDIRDKVFKKVFEAWTNRNE